MAKRQILAEFRAYHRGNPRVLLMIDEFRRTYRSTDAIHWYTKPCFLHQLINQALRSEDILAMYTFRYFIIDMCARIEEMAIVTKTRYTAPFRVYRASIISRDEIEELTVDTLVATNGFFSTSKDLDVAKHFIGVDSETGMSPSRSREDRRQFVLYEIDVDLTHSPEIIVADVSEQSVVSEENEMIFNLGTTFIITHIIYDDEHYIWRIQMSSSSEIDQLNRRYKAHTQERLAHTNAKLLFGWYLADVSSKNQEALEYFHRLLRTVAVDDEDRPNIYFNIARIYRIMGEYQHAIHYYRCAQLLHRHRLPQSSFEYGCALSGLGTVYSQLGDAKRALFFCTRAMVIHGRCLPNNHIELAMNWNRIACAYWLGAQYEHALTFLSHSLAFHKRNIPEDHPCKAQSLHIMGLVHHALGNREQALDCYKVALEMRESMLAADHPLVALTCYRLGIFYAEQDNELTTAIEYARRSRSIWQAKLPSNHPNVKMSMKLVERLLQKQ